MRKNQKEKEHEADNEISETVTPRHFDENENITVKMKRMYMPLKIDALHA